MSRPVTSSPLLACVSLAAAAWLNSPACAEKLPAPQLLELARTSPNAPALAAAVRDTLGEDRIKRGSAYIGEGADFLWAVESADAPRLMVDDRPGPSLQSIGGENLWIATGKLATGKNHTFYYTADGKRFGGDVNVTAYGPDSQEKPGVPKGVLSEKITHKSKLYDGMESDYWIYVPAQYDAKTPAAVMVWNDGGGHVNRFSGSRAQIVVDNLIAQKKIPVMIQVFINPGDISKSPGTPTHDYVTNFSKITGRTLRDAMRSTEYDTVSDRYATFLVDEILAEVGAKYNLRKDGYSRGITGGSSGGVAAFNAAWQKPEWFSRVLSHIGTYTSIQWIPGKLDGGNIFPFAVRKTPRKNFRVWMSDGSEDLENEHGSWPLQNIQLANSLKMADYDFHFTFAGGSHSGAHGNAELPESLTWLWRDYDPAKTSQVYEQEAAEKSKPYYRVKIYNRD
ncbi:MAG: alpha/beta hydrolase [Actinomycetota bacterium]